MDHWDWLNHESSGWLNGWTLIFFEIDWNDWIQSWKSIEIDWNDWIQLNQNWNQWIYQWIKERISKVGPWRRPSESQALGLWHPWPPLLIDVARWAKTFQEAPADSWHRWTERKWQEVYVLYVPRAHGQFLISVMFFWPSASGFFMIGMVAKGPVSPPCSAALSECCRVSPAPISSICPISSACKVQICAFVMNACIKMV